MMARRCVDYKQGKVYYICTVSHKIRWWDATNCGGPMVAGRTSVIYFIIMTAGKPPFVCSMYLQGKYAVPSCKFSTSVNKRLDPATFLVLSRTLVCI